jgi:hypothetical protein
MRPTLGMQFLRSCERRPRLVDLASLRQGLPPKFDDPRLTRTAAEWPCEQNQSLRRSGPRGLNTIERWNGANDFVYFARRGEMANSYCALTGEVAEITSSPQGGNRRTITNNKTSGVTSTMAAAAKPSRPRIGG